MNPSDPFALPSPTTPTDASGNIDWSKVKEHQRVPEAYVGLEAVAIDKAWMREAIIVTIAGVAWFVVGGRT